MRSCAHQTTEPLTSGTPPSGEGPQTAEQLDSQGVEAGRHGRYEEAAELISLAVKRSPLTAKFHSDLGLTLAHLGRFDDAAKSCRRALDLEPSSAEAHHNLAIALRGQGKFDEVVACCRKALELQPNHLGALNDLGLALKFTGQLAEAIESWQRLADLEPGFAAAHINLGNAFLEQKEFAASVSAFQRALAIKSDLPDVRCKLGDALLQLSRNDEARQCYQQALSLNSACALAWFGLGATYGRENRWDEAIAHFRRAAESEPNYAPAHHNLGYAFAQKGKFDEAVASYRRAVQLNADAGSLSDLGCALKDYARQTVSHHSTGFCEAIDCYRRSLALRPDAADTHLNLALLLLLLGQFGEGLPEYEWRTRTAGFPCQDLLKPLSQGECLVGKTLLLCPEQGFGDTIQFVRFVPVLKKMGATILLICQDQLIGLLRHCSGVDRFVGTAEPTPDCDFRTWLLSLPGLLGTDMSNPPANVPYLSAPPSVLSWWHERFVSVRGLKVGIVWQGNPNHRGDKNRSIPLVAFEPIATCPFVRLFSLQKGPGSEQLCEESPEFAITDLAPELYDFVDTAGAIWNLDLVIACDTSVAHLAGALGRPVWVALSCHSDWRWGLTGSTTVWYPTMRLFRQKEPGNWTTVFEEIAQALRWRVRAHSP